MEKEKEKKLEQNRAYQKAKKAGGRLANTPKSLLDLASKVQAKLDRQTGGKLNELLDSIAALTRLMRAYAKGEYRDISLQSVTLVITSMVYFLMPIDAIADFIPLLGFADDAALIAWTLKTVSEDIQRFLQWEASVESSERDMALLESEVKEHPEG